MEKGLIFRNTDKVLDVTKELTDEQLGKVFKCLYENMFLGKEPNLKGIEKIAYSAMKQNCFVTNINE